MMTEIEQKIEEGFRHLVRKKTEEKALEHLNKVKSKHTKVMHIAHSKLSMQAYLEANQHSIQERKFLFALRSRMVDVRVNYRDKYFVTICPCCKMEEDSQEHLLSCHMLVDAGTIVRQSPDYQDLFSNNLERQLNITRILKNNFQRRNKKKTTPSGPSDP